MIFSHWADVPAFLAMGGYGLYVWGSFGMAAAVLAVECLALRGRRQALVEPPARANDCPAVRA